MFRRFKLLVFVAAFGVTGCASSFVPGGGITPDPSLSTVTATVVANVGAPNEMVLGDQLTFDTDLSERMLEIIQENLGFNTNDGSHSNFLVTPASPVFAQEDTPDSFTTTVEIDETEDCTGGGTVQFFGTFELSADTNSSSGTFDGDYAIIYTGCEEEVLFTAADGFCSVTTNISGTLTNTLSIAFYNLDPYGTQNRTEIRNSIASVAPLEFVIESGSAQTVAYDYTFFSHTQSASNTYSGSLTYGGLEYGVDTVQDFIGDAAASSICP